MSDFKVVLPDSLVLVVAVKAVVGSETIVNTVINLDVPVLIVSVAFECECWSTKVICASGIVKLIAKSFRAINTPAWKFDAAKGDTKIADSSDLFDNTDPDNTKCLVNKCAVYKSDCSTAWDFTNDKGFKMSATAPFAITYDSNVNHGYKYDLCVKCNNPQMSATNKFSIQQESRCLPSYNLLAKNPFKLTPTEVTKYEEAKTNDDQETLDQKPTKYAYKYESDFSSSEDPV